MSLEVVEPGGLRGGHHLRVLLLAGRHEGHVHQGPVLLRHRAAEKLALVQEIVQDRGLLPVAPVHLGQAAHLQEVSEDLSAAVDGPAVGRVVEGIGVGVDLVAEVGREVLFLIAYLLLIGWLVRSSMKIKNK